MAKMSRRDALKLVAASTVTATACAKSPSAKAESPQTMEKQVTKVEMKPQVDPVLNVQPLGFPWQTPDPFLFCVHHDDAYPLGNEVLGPVGSLDGRQMGQDFAGKDGWRMYHGQRVPGFPQHPHRGFETVTVVRRGYVDHSDSLGATARYGHGDVQWLTAGKGILHAEMFPLVERETANPLELFQIWLNLPRVNKMVDPHFSMLWADQIPRVQTRDAQGRLTEVLVVAGQLGAAKVPSPPPKSYASQPGADVAVWTLKLDPGAQWTLPAGPQGVNRWLYYFQGAGLKAGTRTIPSKHLLQVRPEQDLALEAGPDGAELLMLQGRPIGEPVVQHGPFVMNTHQEIVQTIRDYQSTHFGGWPWPNDEPVHTREAGRFAKRPDGQIEKPGVEKLSGQG